MRSISSPPRQYTSRQRREALALAERLGTVTAAASQLGIPPHTIYCWRDLSRGRRRRHRRLELQPIEIIDAQPETAGVTVLGPAGLRVEGLSVEQLAQLWRLLA